MYSLVQFVEQFQAGGIANHVGEAAGCVRDQGEFQCLADSLGSGVLLLSCAHAARPVR